MSTKNFADVMRTRIAADPRMGELVDEAAFESHIATEIFNARIDAGLTQNELARRADTSQSVIARLEDSDYHGHSIRLLKKISHALGKQLRVEFCAKPAYTHLVTISTTSNFDWPASTLIAPQMEFSFVSVND